MPHPDPPQPAATPRRFSWRRLVQFRLRTLLMVFGIIVVTSVLMMLGLQLGLRLLKNQKHERAKMERRCQTAEALARGYAHVGAFDEAVKYQTYALELVNEEQRQNEVHGQLMYYQRMAHDSKHEIRRGPDK